MSDPKLTISPRTKVGELLEAYPQLEEVLFSISPSFAALKNPVLRRTVGRVATLSQAATVGGVKVDDLVNRLRTEVGQENLEGLADDSAYFSDTEPAWLDRKKIVRRFNATPIINSGGSPMSEILHEASGLKSGEILEVTSPFVPAPVLDMLRGKGFSTYSVETSGVILNYITLP